MNFKWKRILSTTIVLLSLSSIHIYQQMKINFSKTPTNEDRQERSGALFDISRRNSNNNKPCSVDSFRYGEWKLLDDKSHKDPLFRNLSCPFENLAHSCDQSMQVEKASQWARTFWIPDDGCSKKPFEMLFQTNHHGQDEERTIVFLGDSLTRQTFVALACSLRATPNVNLISHEVNWMKFARQWCNFNNWCFANNRPNGQHNGFITAKGTFRYMNTNSTLHIHFVDSGEFVNEKDVGLHFVGWLDKLPPRSNVLLGDGFRGLHTIEVLKKRVKRFVHLGNRSRVSIAFQENVAPQFPTPNGIFLNDRWNKSLGCVPIANMSLAYTDSPNRMTDKILENTGIPILPTWNATRRAEPSSHINMAKDCLHFCNPGVPVMFAELFTHFLLEDWYTRRWTLRS